MDARELELDYNEVYRHLDYRKGVPEGKVRYAVEQCVEDLVSQVKLKSITRRFSLKFLGSNRFLIGDMELESRTLSRNIRGCDKAYLMAATIGFAMDWLMACATAIGRMSHAVICQAVGATLIESHCDVLNRKFKEEAAAEGKFLCPRFSPGYGDLPLAIQPGLFRVLEIQKRTGTTLTGSLLMMPTKSVMALIGVPPENSHCVLQGCESCSKTNCSSRR